MTVPAAALSALSRALTPPHGDAAAFWELGLAEPRTEELAGEHAALFGAAGAARVPPYAGLRDGRAMHDLLAAYANAGVELDPAFPDRPDHVSAVLACLAHLGGLEHDATRQRRPKVAAYARVLREALYQAHAGSWIPRFFASLADADGFPHHQALARVALPILRDLGHPTRAPVNGSKAVTGPDPTCRSCGGPLGFTLPAGASSPPAWSGECVRCRVRSDLVRRKS